MVVANLKGPVSKCVYKAGLPEAIKKQQGHLCIDLDQALAILEGGNPRKASEDLHALVQRVKNAQQVLSNSSAFYNCTPSQNMSSRDRFASSSQGFAANSAANSAALSAAQSGAPSPRSSH
uniref:Uncharacterized protein n=1 Tax=Alexandrium catenella TaxID=2925 RepID=A0A7S1QDD1_ALECA